MGCTEHEKETAHLLGFGKREAVLDKLLKI